MIHLFNNRKRILFFPIGFANSVARWCLGVHSPSGTINITNTANPSDSGSVALDVNVDALRNIMAGVIEDHDVTGREIKRVKDIVHGTIDGTSLIMGGEHISVSMDWLQQNIQKFLGNETEITHDKITDWDDATADFLTGDDYDALEGAIGDLSDIVDGILDDLDNCLYTTDIGLTVAAYSHTHDGYAATNHTHTGYAAADHTHTGYAAANHTHSGYASANHTHSGVYANASHTHAKTDLTNFDDNVTALIKPCYRSAPVEYSSVAQNYVMFYIPGANGTGTIAYADLDDEYAPKSHTHDSVYAGINHTHDGYAAANHTHTGYAAANHNHAGVYANATHQHVSADITDLGTSIDNKITTFSNTCSTTYATISTVEALTGTVSGLSSDISGIESELSALNSLVDEIDGDLSTVETWKATGRSSTFNIVTGVTWTGSALQMTRKSVTFTSGLITAVGNDSTVTIDTAVLFEQS